ncbi:hypothetical protein A2Y99_04570 [Candidatus Gottesmanbacteria bacterium RBG_13_37_7]|uniref:Uncharacterized protein n=1 Tax=Candidatus Gottesmanbacteria bacterium RBG_13_37_7 TaxID=1798369 RepID=A0A1F5YGD0_9BACT|nr:MAG: hypothetical protein A2Y99_04570 [Candidatus Gottesmanbacteria bacterium RBG_13_37_7]
MKKVIIISLIIGILIGLSFIWYFSQSSKIPPPSAIENITPTSVEEELSNWIDQSEFSFQYPKSLSLNPHDEDQDNYSHVELTSSSHPGYVIVWCKDSLSADIENFVKKNKIEGAIDTTLGGKPAKKVISGTNSEILTTYTIRESYLYQIEGQLIDRNYWNKVYDIVLNSFKFSSTEKAGNDNKESNSVSEETSSADYIEEEELIE